MDIYVDKIRFEWVVRDEDYLFVIVEGKRFLEGTIGRRFRFFMEKFKVRKGKKMVYVSVRKFVIIKIKEKGL